MDNAFYMRDLWFPFVGIFFHKLHLTVLRDRNVPRNVPKNVPRNVPRNITRNVPKIVLEMFPKMSQEISLEMFPKMSPEMSLEMFPKMSQEMSLEMSLASVLRNEADSQKVLGTKDIVSLGTLGGVRKKTLDSLNFQWLDIYTTKTRIITST